MKKVANNPQNFIGESSNGNKWYAEILPNGKQAVVRVNNGKIVGGAVNPTPRVFNDATGFCGNS